MSKKLRIALLVALVTVILTFTVMMTSAATVSTADAFVGAIQTDSEVTLASNITVSGDLAINRAVTVNCNGYGLTFASGTVSLSGVTVTASGSVPAITVNADANLTIRSGCVITTTGSTYVINNNGTLTVEDGSINGTLFANGITTINGGTFRHSGTFRHHSTGAPLVFMNASTATTTINGGDFKKTNFSDGINNDGDVAPDCVIGTNDGDANIIINGGTFTSEGDYGYVLHIRSSDYAEINGGRFVSGNTAYPVIRISAMHGTTHQDAKASVLQGFTTVGGSHGIEFAVRNQWAFTLSSMNASGFAGHAVHFAEGFNQNCTVYVNLSGITNGKPTESPILAGGGLVVLQGSYSGSEPAVCVANGDVTVQVSGATFSGASAIVDLVGGKVTLAGSCDSAVDIVSVTSGDGIVSANNAAGFANCPNGIIHAQGGTVTISGNWKDLASRLVHINGGTVVADGASVSNATAIVFNVASGTLNILSGSYNCSSTASAIVYNNGTLESTVNISGGSFTGGDTWICSHGAAQFYISGTADFRDNATDTAGIYLGNYSGWRGGSVVINGGTFTTDKKRLFNCAGASVTIYDGSFYSHSNTKGAMMFRMEDGDYVSTVSVQGGYFETTTATPVFFEYGALENASAPDGALLISGGSFHSAGGYIVDFLTSCPQAYVLISGGYFYQSGTGILIACRNNGRYAAGYTTPSGEQVGLYITDGTFEAGKGYCINAAGTKICVDGGNFYGSGTAMIIMSDNDVISPVIINGGTFTAQSSCNIINYAPITYAQRNESWSSTNTLPSGSCITRPAQINGGHFTVEDGYVIHLNSIKNYAKADVTIGGGTFTGHGDALIYVTSPSEVATVTVNGGTFILSESDRGGAIIRTGYFTRTDSGTVHYDNPETVHIPTKAKITINGGLFVDERSGNNQVLDFSVGTPTVSIKNAVLLSHEKQPYFLLSADAEMTVPLSVNSAKCAYGGDTYYMWMSTPVTNVNLSPTLKEGAGVRTEVGSEGIRFTSTVSAAVVRKLESRAEAMGTEVIYGTLIAPADFVAAAGGFTIAKLDAYVAANPAFGGDASRVYVNIPASRSLEKNEDGSVSFNGVLVNLKNVNFTRVLAAVPYVKISNSYYYGSYDPTQNARSMAEVAADALRDVGEAGNANAAGDLYAHASVYMPFDDMYSVYTTEEQNTLLAYCGLAPLSSVSVRPSGYSLVYPTSMHTVAKEYAQLLANSLSITVFNGSATTKELLVGNTDRAETATALSRIGGEGYFVGVINEKIVVVGTSDALTYAALIAFSEQCAASVGTSVKVKETIVSDTAVYGLNDAKFVFAKERDGNIAMGFEWGYTHLREDGAYVKDEYGNYIPNYNGVYFENTDYKSELNYFGVDYPVKAVVDLYCVLRGIDESNYLNHKIVKQSAVLPDDIGGSGLKVHMGITDGAITEEMKNLMKSTYGAEASCGYGYRVENGEISIFAYDDTLLRLAVAMFMEDLSFFADGNGGYTVPETLTLTRMEEMAGYGITNAPMPDLMLDGSVYLHNNTYQYYYAGDDVNLSAFDAYCAKLTSNGFTIYNQNDAVEGSYFRTYVNSGKTRMIHVIYAAFAHANEQMMGETSLSYMFEPSLRVVVADVDGLNVNLLPEAWVNGTKSYKKVTDTKITSLHITAADIGNCYIITLEDGSFVVMDGGGGDGTSATSAKLLYDTLVALHTEVHGSAPSASKPITIAAYTMSHGHNDHFVMFQKFVKTYVEASFGKYDGKKSYYVNLEAVIANYISDDEAYNSFDPNILYGRNYLGTSNWYHNTTRSGSVLNYSTVKTAVPYYKVQTGQKFFLRNVEFEILYTHGDTYPWGIEYFNNSSTVFRTTIHNGGSVGTTVSSKASLTAGGTTSVWTGDVQYRGSQVMRAMYGDYLKSDTVQISHHAGNGAEGELYKLVNAKIVFLPSDFARVDGNFVATSNIGTVNRMWLNESDWEYIILHDGFNTTITVTSAGPQMAVSSLKSYVDGNTVTYGQYVITPDTITDYWDSSVYNPG